MVGQEDIKETIIEKVRSESVTSTRSSTSSSSKKSLKRSFTDSVIKIRNKVKKAKKKNSDTIKKVDEFADCHSKCEYCASIFVVMSQVDILKKKYRIQRFLEGKQTKKDQEFFKMCILSYQMMNQKN